MKAVSSIGGVFAVIWIAKSALFGQSQSYAMPNAKHGSDTPSTESAEIGDELFPKSRPNSLSSLFFAVDAHFRWQLSLFPRETQISAVEPDEWDRKFFAESDRVERGVVSLHWNDTVTRTNPVVGTPLHREGDLDLSFKTSERIGTSASLTGGGKTAAHTSMFEDLEDIIALIEEAVAAGTVAPGDRLQFIHNHPPLPDVDSPSEKTSLRINWDGVWNPWRRDKFLQPDIDIHVDAPSLLGWWIELNHHHDPFSQQDVLSTHYLRGLTDGILLAHWPIEMVLLEDESRGRLMKHIARIPAYPAAKLGYHLDAATRNRVDYQLRTSVRPGFFRNNARRRLLP